MQSIDRQILRLALPSILANITIPLVGMVDIAVAGHLDGESAALIGGITIGSMLFDLLYWNFAFLRAGTGGLTAQAYGRGDMRSAADILLRALGIALLSAIVLIAVQWPVVKGAFLFVDCSPQVQELASRYFFIRIWAAPASLSLMAFKGWFIGMQDSVRPMVADLIVNVGNILLSILLAFGTPLGFAGIALGTVIAQYLGFAWCLGALLVKYGTIFKGRSFASLWEAVAHSHSRSFFRLNADLIVRSVCFIAIYIGFTIISARYGDVLLAASAIIMKLMLFFSYFTDGFAYAGEALTGRYIGESRRDAVLQTVRHTFVWSMGIGMLFVLINAFAAQPLFRLMTSDAAVVEACSHFVIWLILMPLVGCPAFTWDGIYLGATATKFLRNSSLWAVASFCAIWIPGHMLLGDPVASVHVLMGAYLAHLVARTVHLTCRRGSIL